MNSKLRLWRFRDWFNRYERYLIPIALIIGFIVDLLTFRFINFDLALVFLAGHLILAALGIILINFYEDNILRGTFFSYARVVSPFILQYSFGALFSAFVIFYGHSGSITASWPFMLVIIFLMIANEIFRKYNVRPDIQISVYFFALFSYANLAIPYLIRDLGPSIFISAGLLSLLVIVLFLRWLQGLSQRVRVKNLVFKISIPAIFVAMNILYFTNMIPPTPLSINDIGVFYDVERLSSDGYRVTDIERNWTERLNPINKHLITSTYRDAYIFSSIFAPVDMEIPVYHEWQYRDRENKKWVTTNRISFTVLGGRNEGFRGYSVKRDIFAGKWRVSIRTSTGQIIGRHTFYVSESTDDLIFLPLIR